MILICNHNKVKILLMKIVFLEILLSNYNSKLTIITKMNFKNYLNKINNFNNIFNK